MASRGSKRIVVDASVARAAGGQDASFPVSKNCRDILLAVLEVCHRVVMTPAINEEWKKHQSNFARAWRVRMEARKKVLREQDLPQEELREKVAAAVPNDKRHEAVLKDFHMIEAALLTDRRVLSLDEVVRRLLSSAAANVGELRNVLWMNPADDSKEIVAWLARGAPSARTWCLGFEVADDE